MRKKSYQHSPSIVYIKIQLEQMRTEVSVPKLLVVESLHLCAAVQLR